MALFHVDFHSDVLGMGCCMDVIMPQKSSSSIGAVDKTSNEKIKTIYLLHGMSDSHTVWQRLTCIELFARAAGVAVVIPTTHLGWYTNAKHGLKYLDFIGKELPQITRSFFPQLSDSPKDTFVAGNSMGGYGALKMALTFPETFGKAGCFSGAFDVVDFARFTGGTYWADMFGEVDKITGSENDLFYLAEKLKSEGKKLPEVYMWCGVDDYLLEHSRKMNAHLTALNYPIDYSESAGNHNWQSWNEQVEKFIKWAVE